MTTTVSPEQSASSTTVPERENYPIYRQRLITPAMLKWVAWSLVGIAAAGLLGFNLYLIQQVNLQRIRITSLEAAFRSGQIRQLSGTVVEMEARVNGLPELFVSRQDFANNNANVKSLFKDQAAEAEQVRQSLTELKQAFLNKTDSLQQGLDQQSLRLDALAEWKSQWEKISAQQKKTPVPTTRRITPKTKKPFRSARTVPLAAPFILTGVERRGGQVFAVVAPRGATSLSQMQLLAPGDSAWGWTLHSTQGNQALFSVNGTQQRLTAQ